VRTITLCKSCLTLPFFSCFEPFQQEHIDVVLSSTGNPQLDRLDLLVVGAGGSRKSTLNKQMTATLLRGYPSYDHSLYQEIGKENVYATVESILGLA
jgi:hypothetical protein